jgi:HD-like signal output (HDOD) protein
MHHTKNDQNTEMNVGQALSRELSTSKIPPRPALLIKIEQEMHTKAPDATKLAELICLDVSISAGLIKIANSPLFGTSREIRSVKDALLILGLNQVSMTIAALSFRKAFEHLPNFERFWDSSARTAQLCAWLTNQLPQESLRIRSEDAFTFGLFRDCGIPVMFSMLTKYFEILAKANNEMDRCFTDIEDDEIGENHAHIGRILATEWKLPIEYQMAIEWHHDLDSIRGLKQQTIPDLPRTGIEPAHQAEEADRAREARTSGCARGDQSMLVNGLHA